MTLQTENGQSKQLGKVKPESQLNWIPSFRRTGDIGNLELADVIDTQIDQTLMDDFSP